MDDAAPDPAAIKAAYMNIPVEKRRAFIDAVGPEIGAILKAATRPDVHGFIDTLVNSTGDQARPGPADAEEIAEGEVMTPFEEQGQIVDQMKRGMQPARPRSGAPMQTVQASDDDIAEALMRSQLTPPAYS